MVDISDPKWSEVDADNNGVAPDGIQGSYSPKTVAPILRATRGSVKRAYNKINAIYMTTGTATALVLTLAATPDALVKGERYAFFASQTNTGAMTLNVNGLGAKSILQQDGAALKAGQVVSGSAVAVIYDGTNFRLENYISNPKFSGTVSADAFTTTGALTAASLTLTGTLSAGATTVASLTSTGALTGSSVYSGGMTVNDAAGTDRVVSWRTANKQRWAAFTNASAESGANAGSDFAIARYADDGTYIDAAFSVTRRDGTVYVEKGLVVKDTLYVGTAGAAYYADGNIKFVGSMATNVGATYLTDALTSKLNKTGGTLTGNLIAPSVRVAKPNGQEKMIELSTDSKLRWKIGATFDAESTGNAGSDLGFFRFDDSGTYIDGPFRIARQTGVTTINEVRLGNKGSLADITAGNSDKFPDALAVKNAIAPMARLDVEGQVVTGGASVNPKDLGTVSTGTLILNPGERPMQNYVNNGAHTLAPGAVNGSLLLDVTNGAAAGAITVSGWTKVAGDTFTVVAGAKFRLHCSIGAAGSLLVIQALQ